GRIFNSTSCDVGRYAAEHQPTEDYTEVDYFGQRDSDKCHAKIVILSTTRNLHGARFYDRSVRERRMIAAISEIRTNHATAGENVAVLDRVEKSYGPVRALSNLRLSVGAGELVALLGPNGAGKTTAVKLLLGLLAPDRGAVRIFGGDPRDYRVRVRTGAMLQVARVPETLRVREHIDLFSSYYPNSLPQAEVLAIAGLESVKERVFGE